MKVHARVAALEEIVGYHFANEHLAVLALTHPSAAGDRHGSASYERLEFLGDSVLGLLAASYVFRSFPDMNEGQLTRIKTALVAGETLSEVCGSLGIGELIILGDSERGKGARGMHKALEDVYEALVGAIYLDGGMDAAREFCMRTLLLTHTEASLAKQPSSAKSRLQEIVQRTEPISPTYKIVHVEGPDHSPIFTAVALIGARRVGRGTGTTKKDAETDAAEDALRNLGYAREAGGGGDVS